MIVKISPKIINNVTNFLKKGGVVICPTDTVYGFLADATNKKAVSKIFSIKKRPKSKPLSLFVKDIAMAKELALINEKQTSVLKKFWPGKHTYIFKRILYDVGRRSPQKIYGVGKDTVAVRIPNHEFLNKLLKKIDVPLAQTSVNISGKHPLDKIDDIIKQFGKANILIINGGDIRNGKASKVIDATKDTINILRP